MRFETARRAWLAAALVLLAAACAQILNVDGIVIVEDEPSSGGAPPVPSTACQPLQLRCEGAALQICRSDQQGFRTAMVCSSPELCCDDPSRCPEHQGCQDPACAPGAFRCEGPRLSVCNEARTGWTPIATCPSATQCNASQGRCNDQPCNASTPDRQCSDSELLECGPTGWASLGNCTTRALCSTDTAKCVPTKCTDTRGDPEVTVPSPFRCDNGDLQRCNDGQTSFEFVETCLNLLHCNDLRSTGGDPVPAHLRPADLENLGCTAPECTPGQYRCDGSLLKRCNQRRTDYSLVQDCGTPGKCNASAGSCSAQDCTPGAKQCSGNDLQVCSAQLTWQKTVTCGSGEQCTLEGCQPAKCEVNEYNCDGAQLQRCNANGSDWLTIHSCATPALCNAAAKRCDPPLCNAGEQRCSRNGTLDRCVEGRNAWQPLSDCRAMALLPESATPEQLSGVCDLSGGGRCNTPASCPEGSLRCNGQYLERCRANAWQPRERCATSALCDASGTGSCRPAACTPGEYRCVTPGASPIVAEPNDSMLGLTLQVCDTTGAGFVNVRDCAGDAYCDAGHGQCDLCQAIAPLCFGSSLYFCSTDGQERELEKACSSGCVENPANMGRPACREDLGAAGVGNP